MKSGIYKILNRLTNDFYIGSSCNLTKRIGCHKNNLRKNKHQNPHLQNACNKYGEHNFEFVIIKECEKSKTLIEEQSFIDLYKPAYNICQEVREFPYIRNLWNNEKHINFMKEINKGSNHPQSKIDEHIASLIKLDIQNKVKRGIIISKYNITINIYKDIRRGKTWKHA